MIGETGSAVTDSVMSLKKFATRQPKTVPPEPEGWQQFWYGYFQMTKVRSQKKRIIDKKDHAVSNLPADVLGEGEFEKQLFLNIIHNIKKDHINMFELGAGRGDWCLSLAGVIDFKLVPCQAKTYRCLALEGEPTHYKWTREHFEHQRINGIAIHGAIQDYNGYCKFDASTNPADHYGQCVSKNGNILIPCFTIDKLMQDNLFDHVDIVHMDVQGAEYKALIGAYEAIKSGAIDYMLIGTHAVGGAPTEMNRKIKQLVGDRYHCVIDIPPKTPLIDTRLGAASLPLEGRMLFQRKGIKPVKLKQAKGDKCRNFDKERRYVGTPDLCTLNYDDASPVQPKLSIVAAGRNDDHGGNLLGRMQTFVNGVFAQSEKFRLQTELIIVEWNPPADRPRLAKVLSWPAGHNYCTVRIIEVPAEVHNRYKHSDALPLYQMVAKNVGIRRARGAFILATSIDILFSDELFAWMASGQLQKGRMYRVNRYDVESNLPTDAGLDKQLRFCAEHVIRINERSGTRNLLTGDVHRTGSIAGTNLHTNGCGDFQLMHRDNWFQLCGYPEFDMFSFHLDSLLAYCAHFSGISQHCLSDPMRVYHIEHQAGWTPEVHKKGTLWKRLETVKIKRMTNAQLNAYVEKMKKENKPIIFNDDNWGLRAEEFKEDLPVRAEQEKSDYATVGRIGNVAEHLKRPDEIAGQDDEKYLSIVVASRNDDHGGNLLHRMQIFANGLAEQCKRFNLNAELIIVEWNPPAEKKRLYEVLEWPDDLGPLTVRFIEVPAEVHNSIGNSDKFPLFQMIAKNVGIRRAKGKFVLATNIDILFSDELMQVLASKQLGENCFYRIDRHDVSSKVLPGDKDIGEQLEFCRNNPVRVQGLYGTKKISQMESDHFVYGSDDTKLHTNACGDFTLMSRTKWHLFRAYPELPKWSIYVDGLLLHMAYAGGVQQVILGEPMRVYHIEHDTGWSAIDEAEQKLAKERYPSLDYQKEYLPWCRRMIKAGQPITNNDENWGYAGTKFNEYVISGRWKEQREAGNVTSQDNNCELFEEWIDTLASAQNRLYYRDQTPESLNALVELVHRYNPTTVVELGTLSGFSLRAWLAAKSQAEVIAIDLSFKPLFESQKILPVDLSGVRLLEQNILETDFSRLWSKDDKVILYIDVHDLPDAGIMAYILKNALPVLPQGSIVAVDDLWYSLESMSNDSVSRFFEEIIDSKVDSLQCFEGYYAPYWKGGFFVGFREVVPLMEWVNRNKVELVLNPGDKAVMFEYPTVKRDVDESFDIEAFKRLAGGIRYNPVEIFGVYSRRDVTGNREAAALCEQGVQFYASGRIKEALDCFGQALHLAPDVKGAFYAQAVCFARAGNFEMAAEKLRMEMNSEFPHPRAQGLYEDVQQYIRKKHKPISKVQEVGASGDITIFAIPKAFRGGDAVRQRNAIKSWVLLEPRPEIILCGDDEGVAEIAHEFGLRHIPDVKRNSYGTPLLNDLFSKAQAAATNEICVYVNADIVLMNDFVKAIEDVSKEFGQFLMIGRRWDIDITEEIDFNAEGWPQRLRQRVQKDGFYHAPTGVDYFAFRKGLWPEIPPFGIGRYAWDNWLVNAAVTGQHNVVDASQVVMAVHQNHDFSHIPGGKNTATFNIQRLQNRKLAPESGHKGFTTDATWELTPAGLVQRVLALFSGLDSYMSQLCQSGSEKLRQGDAAEALAFFDEALSKCSTISGLQTARASCLVKLQKLNEAASAARAELALQPNHRGAQRILELINRMRKYPQAQSAVLQKKNEQNTITPITDKHRGLASGPAARQFISDYFERQLKTDVQNGCCENAGLYEFRMIDTGGEQGDRVSVAPLSSSRPKVSIILSCYNAEKFLPECLDSIRNQTMRDWELFVLDDASTDGTRGIIEKYSRMDERIKAYYFQDNEGPYVRRNFAIERANSDFIVIQDADDIMCPAKLETLYNEITRDKQLGIVGSSYRSFLDEFRGLEYTDRHDLPLEHNEVAAKFSSFRHGMSHGSAIIRKDLFEAIGLYDGNPFASDSFWFAKAAEYAKHCPDTKFKNVPEHLTLIRIHDNSQTQLLPTLDPRNKRALYRQYCNEKLGKVRQKLKELPHADIKTELKNCVCSDFIEKYGHLFARWEDEPLDRNAFDGQVNWAAWLFNERQYVRCIARLNSLEKVEPNIEKRFKNYDLLRAMAYFAIDRKKQSLTYLNREIENHNNLAARKFISDYFEGPDFAETAQNVNSEKRLKTDVQNWCLENSKFYDLRIIDLENERDTQQEKRAVCRQNVPAPQGEQRHSCPTSSSGQTGPLVSIIMPAYNAANYIAEAIGSVLTQSHRNFELIVVDDGSTDNTKDIILGFKDERIKYFYKENGGPASARNLGIKKSEGVFVINLDADDMMTPDFIAGHLAEFEEHPEADLVYCDDCLIDENDKPIRVIERPEYSDRKLLIRDLFRHGFPIVPFRTCIRRSGFDKIGLFDEGLLVGEDYDMMRRFVKQGLKIHHLLGALYLRRITPTSLSRSFTDQKAKSHFEVVKRFTETFAYDELFPDVAWDKIHPKRRQLHAKCLAGMTYLAIGQAYVESNSPVYAKTACELACSELNDCLKMDPGNRQLRQLLQRCEFARAGYSDMVPQAVC